jgi:formamidopyrimidine-DNA glycosylase
MPELPEVETVVRELRPLAVGRTIRTIVLSEKSLRRPWNDDWTPRLIGQRLGEIQRRGKWILLNLQYELTLVVHLGMTGQFTVVSQSEKADEHVHVRFGLENQRELRFRDIRRFGSITLFTSVNKLHQFLEERVGPEPFNVLPSYFRNGIQSSSRSLKALLLDQSLIAGVGNIYADESCFLARLHPARRGVSLTDAEVDQLRVAIEQVLTRAIDGRGSTIRNYVGGSGLKGTYQHEFAVYGRTGESCLSCNATIEVRTLSGRSSHYCPRCQPEPSPKRSRKS